MSFDFSELERLKEVSVTLPTDEQGYLGRECPEAACEGYFLVRLDSVPDGAGENLHCPYCGVHRSNDEFHTQDQIEYAKSIALRKLTGALVRDLKKLEFNHPPRGLFGIGFSMTLQPGPELPIRHYREKALETFVTCAACAVDYAVYGVFGYCPGCGGHNSLHILEKNLDLTRRQVDLAGTVPDEALRRHLIEDALENCVSALDGFGRESLRVRAGASSDPARCAAASFQNLEKGAATVDRCFGVDLHAAVPPDVWTAAHRGFMKRHVVAHRAGVVDQAYLNQTGDAAAVVGRKVPLEPAEVVQLAHAVAQIGRTLLAILPAPAR